MSLDALRSLQEQASPGPWRWQVGDGVPFRDGLLFSADGGSAIAGLPNNKGRVQTDANAALMALATHLLPIASALEAYRTELAGRNINIKPLREADTDARKALKALQEALDA